MAKLSIEIVADGRKAINSFNATTTSLGKLRTELASAQNAQAKGANNTQELEKATEAYLDKLQRQESAMTSGALSAKDLEKALNRIANEQKKLSAIMDSNESVDKVFSEMKTYYEGLRSELETATEKQREFEKQSRVTADAQRQLTEDNAALAYYDLIGDETGKAAKQLDIYERQLRDVLRTSGKDSQEAKKLADSIKTQKKAIDELGKASRKATPSVKGLFKEFVKGNLIASGVESVFRKAIQVMSEAGRVAAHAEETINLFNTTFENIQNIADKTASTLQNKMGLANSSAKEALGIFGDLALGYGQTQTAALEFAEAAVKTTLDLISFKNIEGDTVEIMRNFSSGLVGNYENFKKLGIIVTASEIDARLAAKGMENLTGAAGQFARAQEALLIVQEKSKNASGDMEKTLNSTANVTRRVQEENKALMENMGRSVNVILNPFKLAWLEIASAINRAEEAQRQFNAGNKDIKVFDVANNFFDRSKFQQDVIWAKGSYEQGMNYKPSDSEKWLGNAEESIRNIMIMYGVSAADMIAEINRNYSSVNDELTELVDEIAASVENEKRLQAEKDNRTASLESELSSAQKFVNMLNGVAGAGTSTDFSRDLSRIGLYSGSAAATEAELNWIPRALNSAISESISNLDNATWQTFSDGVSLALGTATEKSGLEAKLASARALYDILNTKALEDGIFSEDEAKSLERVAKIFKDINEDLQDITEEQKRISAFSGSIGSVTSQTTAMEHNIAKFGMSDMDAALYDLDVQKDLALSYAKTQDEIEEVNQKFEKLVAVTTEYYSLVERENRKGSSAFGGNYVGFNNEYEGKWSSFINGLNPTRGAGGYGASEASRDAYNQIMEQGKTEWESLLEAYKKEGNMLLTFGITTEEAMEQLEDAAKHAAEAIDAANWKALGTEAAGKLGGEVGQIAMAATGQGATGNIGVDLLGLAVDIASKLEVVQKASSLVSDSIVPVLDAFLRPLLPLIEMTSGFLSATVSLLETVYPIWKTVVATITYIVGSIYNAIMFLYDGIKYCFDWIWNQLAKALDMIIWGDQSHWQKDLKDPVKAWQDRQEKLNQTVDKIMASTMEVEKNTDKDSPELRILEDLFKQGVLSANEYLAEVASLTGGPSPDAVTAMKAADGSYMDFRNIGEKTVVNTRNNTFYIESGNKSAEEIARAIYRTEQQDALRGKGFGGV